MDPRKLELAAAAYFLGGIPTGYLLARRLRGIDIRLHGSGNPGAANVYRVVGRWPGFLTLVVDALKGWLPVMAAKHFFPGDSGFLIACGAMAIVGHIWTVYLGFRGGKGVATSCGVFAALVPLPTAAAVLVFAAAVAFSGHISVGSMSAAAAVPFAALASGAPFEFTLMAAAAAALIFYKHLPNLRRLRQGGELSIEKRALAQARRPEPARR